MILNENRNRLTDKVYKNVKTSMDKSANCLLFDLNSQDIDFYLSSHYPYPYSQLITFVNSLREYDFIKVMKLTTTDCFN